ncbi:MAG: VanZ family protein [Bacteroidales bacterium]|nr:VanZ family protein [Bacteroidales bacterium]
MDKDSFHLQIPHFDKIVHCVIFMILTALICIETRYVELSNKIKILIISALFGFTIEVIQYFEPWRSFDLWDLAADILGAYLGILMSKYLITRIYK